MSGNSVKSERTAGVERRATSRTRCRSTLLLAVAAVPVVAGHTARGQSLEWVVSTSGATALGQFTSANRDRVNPTFATIERGTLAIGTNFKLGSTTYTVPTVGARFFGIANLNAPLPTEPSFSDHRVVYYYRESGSIQGILDTADSGGLLIASGNVPLRPGDPAANLFVFVNGARFNSTASGYSSGSFPDGIPNLTAPTPDTGYRNGRNYTREPDPIGLPEVNANGQPLVRIGWTDVRFQQAFALNEGANPNEKASYRRTPTTPGYGIGPKPIGSSNVQPLRNSAAITGGIGRETTRLRNESLAVIPFNIVANPGTGLAEITQIEGKWLQVVGRLPNGVEFNSVTREIGSGTRNQGALNLGLDPSWGGGERDRRYLGTTPIVGGNNIAAGERPDVRDNDGNFITITPGSEMITTLNLLGGTTQNVNENRISPIIRFADKISGSVGVRQTVVNNRMALGILSAGDSNSSTAGTAIASLKDTTPVPMRALKIDWDNDGPLAGTQATAENTTSGAYRLWSAAQAVTVAPYAGPERYENPLLPNGQPNPEFDPVRAAWRPIFNDINDQNGTNVTLPPTLDGSGNVTNSDNVGLHRKFLDNITRSVATFTGVGTAVTPADFIISSRYIPTQIMGVEKIFDGAPQTPRTRSTVDPDGPSGPLVSEQELYNNLVGPGKFLTTALDWGDPGTTNGGIANRAVFYRIFATNNTNTSTAPTAANRAIQISPRTNLVGDFNGDGVRDLNDTAALALAYASPARYLQTPASGDPNGWNYNGAAVVTPVGSTTTWNTSGTNAADSDGLIVLSDFDGNGNVIVDANDATFATRPIDRADVAFFLWGATVDTGAPSTDPNVNRNKRENLIRSGLLRKNFAIDLFNTTLDGFVGVVTDPNTGQPYTQSGVNKLKFSKLDVDGSGTRDFPGLDPLVDGNDYRFLVDAFAVDKFGGQRYDDLDQHSVATLPQPFRLINNTVIFVEAPFNLARADLDDSADRTINQLDMNVMNAGMTGRVDHAWGLTNTKPGSLVIQVAATSGTFSVPMGATFTINAGSFAAGGTVDPFSQGSNRLSIINNSAGVGSLGGLAVTAGTKSVAAVIGTGRTTVSAGATLVVNPGTSPTNVLAVSQSELGIAGTLRLAQGSKSVAIVDTLAIASTGFFDLTDNALIVRSTVSGYAAEIAAVRSLVGGWYTASAGLPGSTGLGSSLAFYPAAGAFTTLAVYDNSGLPTGGTVTFSTFAGQAVTANDILVKYTYIGDTNLDGVVDASDLSRALQGLNGGGTGWNFGDVNYDGVINFVDLGRILAALRGQGAPLSDAVGGVGGVIPEPAALGLLAPAALLLSRRRR